MPEQNMPETAYLVTVPENLIPPPECAILAASTPPPFLYALPTFRGFRDPYPWKYNQRFVRVSELITSPFRAMHAALQAHGADVVVSRRVACCAYFLGVAGCTSEQIRMYLPDIPLDDISQQLHRLRFEIAIDCKVLPTALTDDNCRAGECT